MTRRTDFQKAITYTGQKIKGPVEISYKIDGVRILYRDGELVTRNNKKPPGLLGALTNAAIAKLGYFNDCEIYTGKFKDVQGPISRHDPQPGTITERHIYPLVHLDPRLYIRTSAGLEKDSKSIQDLLARAVEEGY